MLDFYDKILASAERQSDVYRCSFLIKFFLEKVEPHRKLMHSFLKLNLYQAQAMIFL